MTTLAELKTRSRERSDMVNNEFISSSELTNYINESGKELYDILVQKFTDDYFVESTEFPLVSGQNDYALPSDFYKLLGVDAKINSNDYLPLKKFNFRERNKYREVALFVPENIRYRLVGSNLRLSPTNSGSTTIRLWYVPKFVALVDDTDVLITDTAWDEFVIVTTAIKMLQKEESDVTVLYRQKQDLIDRIESAAANRDAAESDHITDITKTYNYDDYYWWNSYD
jgi:hypothetical protein